MFLLDLRLAVGHGRHGILGTWLAGHAHRSGLSLQLADGVGGGGTVSLVEHVGGTFTGGLRVWRCAPRHHVGGHRLAVQSRFGFDRRTLAHVVGADDSGGLHRRDGRRHGLRMRFLGNMLLLWMRLMLVLRGLLILSRGRGSRSVGGDGRSRREDLILGLGLVLVLRGGLWRRRVPGEMGDSQGREFFLPALWERGEAVSGSVFEDGIKRGGEEAWHSD